MAQYFPLLLILLRSFNAIAYVLMAALHFRERETRWGGAPYRALVLTFGALYLESLTQEFAWAVMRHGIPYLSAVDALGSMLVAPLLFHTFYASERSCLPLRRLWRSLLEIDYAIGAATGIAAAAVAAGIWPAGAPRWLILPSIVCGVAGGAGVLCMSRRAREGPMGRRQRLSLLLLCLAWAAIVGVDVFWRTPWLLLLKHTCPLVFLFIITYHVERLTFFDVLLKKAVFAFASLLLLNVYFVFVTPWIWRLGMRGWMGTLVWACSILPIVLLAPWGHRKLARWVDRLCLGRPYAPAKANEHFFAGLQGAIGERELVGLAEQRLEEIYEAPAEVTISPDPPAPQDGSIAAPITLHGDVAGAIRIHGRARSRRFLSEDVALLASLAQGFSFLLENLRLREKRLEQDKRERELILNANRSELKALRAQVNPHFLFNALNAIAGLIPEDPDRAERTIEQLGEVFRYTLSRSDREWVRLGDELEAVRAYLDIEQARFRERLEVRFASSPEARSWRIPAMTVQTLVENAVKHGVAVIRAPGLVEIEAAVENDRLRLEVRDNGPGFSDPSVRPATDHRGGYGLRNVRERLQGHFGGDAELRIERDASRGLTVVRVEIPLKADGGAA